MRDLSQEHVWTFTEDHPKGDWDKCQVRKFKGCFVKGYKDLAAKVAAVQFHNPNFVLLFRGQDQDYRLDNSQNKNSTIRPEIFRRDDGHGAPHWNRIIDDRYNQLERAEKLLVKYWQDGAGRDLEGRRRLTRSASIRWAILQHYKVCPTPLLDVTHSLRIACSFASLNQEPSEAFVMVLAAPQISGAVSACAYHEMQVLRLSALCPPTASRPHLQEGYLLGEYPELRTFDEKMNLELHETDFGQRLIAKFRLDTRTFWNTDRDYPQFPKEALSLGEGDRAERVREITNQVAEALGELSP